VRVPASTRAGNEVEDVSAVVREVGSRLADARRIEAEVAAAPQQTAHPQSTNWFPYSITQGLAGLVVTFGYLDACFPDEGWDIVAHGHLERAVAGASAACESKRLPGPGLFSGLTGLAFAAWYVSRDGSRYRRLLDSLDEMIVPQAVALSNRVRRQAAGPVSEFDTVSGLSGVAAYLLCRRTEPGVAIALEKVARSLVELSMDAPVLRWQTPAHMLGDEISRRLYPAGNLNCGLAHGIPGPLAALSLVRKADVQIEGLCKAIDRIAAWLLANRLDDAWGPNWPTAVPQRAAAEPAARARSEGLGLSATSRAAWCYGSPGIARALWLARGSD
jgi:lantibiotic biosynthesis protein